MIPMSVSQHTSRSQARRSPVIVQAVRRGARVLKHTYDEQSLMWEGFWRANRFPVDHP